MAAQHRSNDSLISIVVPGLDEESCVPEFAQRTRKALEDVARYEILFIDDGSRDETPQRIAELRRTDASIKTLRFTRSFGHQAALIAGLAHAQGDAIVTMDGDLQHPPELLPALIEAWRDGADVVDTIRGGTQGAAGNWKSWKDRVGNLFYRLMRVVSNVPVVRSAADFRLLDRRVVDHCNAFEEHFLFLRGLIPWLGFSAVQIPYQVEQRFAGTSKYNLWPMLRLALNGIFSFSVLPLRLITLLGLATTAFGVLYGVFALVSYLTGRVTGPDGWTSLMVVMMIFGGVQLLSLGVVSEYLGRVYEEVKRRPRYVIESKTGLD